VTGFNLTGINIRSAPDLNAIIADIAVKFAIIAAGVWVFGGLQVSNIALNTFVTLRFFKVTAEEHRIGTNNHFPSIFCCFVELKIQNADVFGCLIL